MSGELARENLRYFADSCAGWLVRVQRPDGSWPLFLDPRDESVGPFDFIRSAVAAYGLSVFSHAAGGAEAGTDAGAAARKAFAFLQKKLLQDTGGVSSDFILLQKAYMGNLAYALGEEKQAELFLDELLRDASDLPIAPLLHSQTLFLAHSLSRKNTRETRERERIAQLGARLGEVSIKAAHWDGIPITLWLESLRGLLETPYESAGILLADKAAGLQTPEGSFRNYTGQDAGLTSTRGTGKILEILALKPKCYGRAIERALSWLRSVQYSPDAGTVGMLLADGFKHDVDNPQAWIDANGHTLTGLVSLLEHPTSDLDAIALGADTLGAIPSPTIVKNTTVRSIISAYYAQPSRYTLPLLPGRMLASLGGTKSELPAYWRIIERALQKENILEGLRIAPSLEDEPHTVYAVGHAYWDDAITDGYKPALDVGRGVTFEDLDEALSIAFGECLERIPFMRYRQEDLVRASAADLESTGSAFLDPKRVSYFSEYQQERFPDRKFSKHSVFSWIEGHSLLDGQPILLPAQLIYWNYNRDVAGVAEPFLRESSTHGGGGFFTKEKAILSGIYEWIQRDGFFVHWLNGHAPRRVTVSKTHDAELSKVLREFDRLGIEPIFLDITTETGVPAVACALIDRRPGYPAVVFGAGCSANPNQALHRAAIEAMSIHHWVLRMGENLVRYEPGEKTADRFTDKNFGAGARLSLWGQQDMLPHIAFFTSGEKMSLEEFLAREKKFSDEKAEYQETLRSVRSLGEDFQVYAYESRHPVLQLVGYHAAKTFIPGLFPLYLRHSSAPITHPRLKSGAHALGFKPREEPFPLPHPFP